MIVNKKRFKVLKNLSIINYELEIILLQIN